MILEFLKEKIKEIKRSYESFCFFKKFENFQPKFNIECLRMVEDKTKGSPAIALSSFSISESVGTLAETISPKNLPADYFKKNPFKSELYPPTR